jgi:AcrR family transcriptional regulator
MMARPTPTPARPDRGPAAGTNPADVGSLTTVPPDVAVSPLRQDAARNRAKILAAARAAFDEEGVDVGVETIAQRAGVGVGTLYRRFPTKELLIEAVIEEVLGSVLAAAHEALDHESAADGFAHFLRAVGQLQFEHAGCLARLWNDSAGDVRHQIEATTHTLLSRAQAAGAVRQELVYEDVIVLFWSLRGVIEATSSVSPDAWLRHFELLLVSLAPSDRPLEHPPLTPQQVVRARSVVAGGDHSKAALRASQR